MSRHVSGVFQNLMGAHGIKRAGEAATPAQRGSAGTTPREMASERMAQAPDLELNAMDASFALDKLLLEFSGCAGLWFAGEKPVLHRSLRIQSCHKLAFQLLDCTLTQERKHRSYRKTILKNSHDSISS